MKPEDPGSQEAVDECWRLLAPLYKKAKAFLAIDPVIKRLQQLEVEDLALQGKAISIIQRLDELAAVISNQHETGPMARRLRELVTLIPHELKTLSDDEFYSWLSKPEGAAWLAKLEIETDDDLPDKLLQMQTEMESLMEHMNQTIATTPAAFDREMDALDHELKTIETKRSAIETEAKLLAKKLQAFLDKTSNRVT